MQALRHAFFGALLLAVPLAIIAVLGNAVAGAANVRIIVNFLIAVVLVLSIQAFSGNSGIISFGHVAFMAVGAYVAAIATVDPVTKQTYLYSLPHFALNHTVGFVPAIALGTIAGAFAAAVLGGFLARMRESAMAMATLGLLVIVFVVSANWGGLTNGTSGLAPVPESTTMYSALAFAVVVAAACRAFRDSHLGLQLRGSRTDPLAAEALGANVVRLRWFAWIFSGAVMGLGGALWAEYNLAVDPSQFYFDETFSLLAMLVVGGLAAVSGGVIGVAVVTAVFQTMLHVENGVAVPGLTQMTVAVMILVILNRRPEGLVGLLEIDDRIRRRVRFGGLRSQAPAPTEPPAAAPGARPPTPAMLRLDSIEKRFGGLVALKDVSLQITEGEIVGLIGPNGSGKTTLLNIASGVLRPTSGRVLIDGTNATGRSPHRIAALGVGRTFQQVRLFRDMTVLENVALGAVARHRSPEIALPLLERLRSQSSSDRLAVTLAYGEQRRVEIARALAGQPRFLLLDEPAAGMNEAESDDLLETILRIREHEGCAVLIVDHDLRLIMRLCERIHVLAEGQTICEGSPEVVRRDPSVISAYLGRAADVSEPASANTA